MLSDEEQLRIAERVKFEINLRKQLSQEAQDKTAKKEPWWEGKLVLLLIGGLITGCIRRRDVIEFG
jgi:hypothetical protein